MQEFAHSKESSTASPSGHWPSDAELAAYIDGNLGKAERRRIEEHLADCEECFAVYMGTLQFQSEEGNVVPFPSKKGMDPRWWYRIAALLVLGVGLGGAYYALLLPPPALVTSQVARSIPEKPGLADSLWLGPTFRGGGNIASNPAPFQTGVQLINLQVSLEANQGEQAQDVVARILGLLESQYGVEELKEDYKGITVAIANGAPAETLAGKASELALQTKEAFLEDPPLDLGQWVEAGRLAAIAGEPSFFEDGDNRAFLRRLLWRQKLGLDKEMKLDPAARQSLQDISSVLEKKELGRSDYAKLRRDFESILSIYYPES